MEYKELIEAGTFCFNRTKITFAEKAWVVSSSGYEVEKRTFLFEFELHELELKLFIANEMIKGKKKASTIYHTYLFNRKFLRTIREFQYSLMDQIEIMEVLSLLDSEKAMSTIKQHIQGIREMFDYFNKRLNIKTINPIRLNLLISRIKSVNEGEQYKLLNFDVYQKMIDVLQKEMNDSSRDMYFRIKTACVLFVALTGIRSNETIHLPFDPICYLREDFPNHPFFKYYSIKNSKTPKSVYYPTNDSIVDLIKNVQSITNNAGKEKDLLFFCGDSIKNTLLSNNALSTHLKILCYIHREELNLINYGHGEKYFNGISDAESTNKWVNDRSMEKYGLLEKKEVFYYPNLHQFRVMAITQFLRGGVSLPEVSLIFNHKNIDQSIGYYRSIDATGLINTQVGKYELMQLEEIVKYDKMSLPATINVINTVEEAKDIADEFAVIRKVTAGYCVDQMGSDCKEALPMSYKLPFYYSEKAIMIEDYLPKILMDLNDLKVIIETNSKNGFIKQNNHEKLKLKAIMGKIQELKQKNANLSSINLKEYEEYVD